MEASGTDLNQLLSAAVQHHQAGQLVDAERLYRQALSRLPNHPDLLHLLGVLNAQLQRNDVAATLIGQALSIRPAWPEAHNNLGNVLRALGDLDGAADAFRHAITLNPGIAEGHNNLGNVLADSGDAAQAIGAYRRAVELKPDYAEALNNLGHVLTLGGQVDEAITVLQQAIATAPNLAGAHNNIAGALKDAGRVQEAVAAYRKAVQIDPTFCEAHSNLIYTLTFCPGVDAGAIAQEHQRWNRAFAEPLRRLHKPHTNDRDPIRPGGRRLRIGYVSPDFRAQAEAHFVVPLLEAHDKEQFEIHAYASVARPDHITERLRRATRVWHDVLAVSNQHLAEQIRRDGIDILVDLSMHMGRTRLPLFAIKPAPVQVAWLAYPGSTGLVEMDYRITDAYMDPPPPAPGDDERGYSERSVRLPDSWCCYDPLSDTPPAAPTRQPGFVRFGSLNNFCKVNEPLLNLWAQVLLAVADSRLLLLVPQGSARQTVRGTFRSAGVDPDRVEFCAARPREEYLRGYDRIDIALDPLPYNGITTTLDALWMGVPVVSLTGTTAAGRAGLSLLSTLGLPELVARTPAELVEIASMLACDLARLAQMRATLRRRVQESPLMDGPRFARHMEAAYRQMWGHWCRSQE